LGALRRALRLLISSAIMPAESASCSSRTLGTSGVDCRNLGGAGCRDAQFRRDN
jgi:hypothetical protein